MIIYLHHDRAKVQACKTKVYIITFIFTNYLMLTKSIFIINTHPMLFILLLNMIASKSTQNRIHDIKSSASSPLVVCPPHQHHHHHLKTMCIINIVMYSIVLEL